MTRTNQNAGNRALQIGGSVNNGSIISAGAGVTIIVQQVPAQEPNPPPMTNRMTPAEVLALIGSMPRDQRLAVLEFIVKNMGEDVLNKLDAHNLWRIQRYAQVIIERSPNA